MLSIGHKIVQRSRLTVGAVFILGSINGAIRLHLQLEALSTGEPGHNPLQLGLWEEQKRHISCLHPLLLSCDQSVSLSVSKKPEVSEEERLCVFPITGPRSRHQSQTPEPCGTCSNQRINDE